MVFLPRLKSGSAVMTIPVVGTRVVGVPQVTAEPMLVMGEPVLLGAMALEGMDLVVDCARGRLLPNVGTLDQPVFRV